MSNLAKKNNHPNKKIKSDIEENEKNDPYFKWRKYEIDPKTGKKLYDANGNKIIYNDSIVDNNVKQNEQPDRFAKWNKFKADHNIKTKSDVQQNIQNEENDPYFKWRKYEIDPKTGKKLYDDNGDRVDGPSYLIRGEPVNKVKARWKKIGFDYDYEMEYLDKKVSTDKNGREVINYVTHDPSWGDRAKEVGQGLAAFGGGTVDLINNGKDLINNYVAAPVTMLGANALKGGGKLLDYAGANTASNYVNELGDTTQALSDYYWNADSKSNYANEYSNAKFLKTKNKDLTSKMLKGIGEFAPEVLPANLIGKGVKAISTSAKVAPGLLKSAATKLAPWVETPITGFNIAAFGGAGATHGLVKGLNNGKENPLWVDIPAMMIGSGLGGGAYALGKGGAKTATNLAKKAVGVSVPKELSYGNKKLANYINNGNNELDEEFILAARKAGVDLTAHNIYKDNARPFTISKLLPNPEYTTNLPKLKGDTYDAANRILDRRLGKYNTKKSQSDIALEIKNIANTIQKANKHTSSANYADLRASINPEEYIIPTNLKKELKELINETKGIGTKGTDVETLHNISKSILNEIPKKGISYIDALNLKKAINAHVKKAPLEIGSIKGRNLTRLNSLKEVINQDIQEAVKVGTVKRENVAKQFNTEQYYIDKVASLKKNPMMKEMFNENPSDSQYTGTKAIIKAIHDRQKLDELRTILAMSEEGSIRKTAFNNLNDIKRIEAQKTIFDNKRKNTYKPTKIIDNVTNSKNEFLLDTSNKRKIKKVTNRVVKNNIPKNEEIIYNDKLLSPEELINSLKRIEAQKAAFKGKSKNTANLTNLVSTIAADKNNFLLENIDKDKITKIANYLIKKNNNGNNGYFKKQIKDAERYNKTQELTEKYKKRVANNFINDIEPLTKKYDTLINKNKLYDLDKVSIENSNYFKNLPALGLGGGVLGGFTVGGPVGTILGAAGGVGINLARNSLSKKVLKSMTDKQFVEELIRLGRIPAKDKDTFYKKIQRSPSIRINLTKKLLAPNSNKEQNKKNKK